MDVIGYFRDIIRVFRPRYQIPINESKSLILRTQFRTEVRKEDAL